jgi:hypothetical protein
MCQCYFNVGSCADALQYRWWMIVNVGMMVYETDMNQFVNDFKYIQRCW